MLIKEINKSYIDTIMDIWLEENITAHYFIPSDYWISNYALVRDALFDAEVIVFEDNVVKGFVGILNQYYVAGLFVSKQFHGHGVGSNLINECKRRYSSLELSVYLKNTNAVEFYKNHGFIIKETKYNEDTKEKEYIMLWNRNAL